MISPYAITDAIPLKAAISGNFRVVAGVEGRTARLQIAGLTAYPIGYSGQNADVVTERIEMETDISNKFRLDR